ncbi:MAG: putative transporter [Bacteroidales bacterium]|nr:putative transporter [Bacteroidales bacterium]
MDWILDLLFKDGIAHSILLLSFTIMLGIKLGKFKVANISLGITWILFVGIILGHFGLSINEQVLNYTKELGLILFIFAIGLQVGPGFFSSLRKGGLRLNMLASSIVLLGAVITYILHLVTDLNLSTMTGILSGAVTNTPGLGAAQQTFRDINGASDPTIAQGYAVAYPLGVIGIILTMISIRYLFRINIEKENNTISSLTEKKSVKLVAAHVSNKCIDGHTIKDLMSCIGRPMIVSRVKHSDGQVEPVNNQTILRIGDLLRIVTEEPALEKLVLFVGEISPVNENDWETPNKELVSRKVVVTKPSLNGERIGNLHIRSSYGVNITRINRAGIELVATHNLQLQMGDRLTVVGKEDSIKKVADLVGNSMIRLYQPNLIPIFLGIFAGIILGSIPFSIPGIPQPVKLGLAGGPLIVAILMARYGPYYKIVTFSTTSANMMIREIGISLFLAAVGLDAGNGFVDTILNGGYYWVLYGIIITIVPLFLVGLFARLYYKIDYFTIMGLLSGSYTDPPALAFANEMSPNDLPAVAYATVYPLTMFLRVLTAQVLIILS